MVGSLINALPARMVAVVVKPNVPVSGAEIFPAPIGRKKLRCEYPVGMPLRYSAVLAPSCHAADLNEPGMM